MMKQSQSARLLAQAVANLHASLAMLESIVTIASSRTSAQVDPLIMSSGDTSTETPPSEAYFRVHLWCPNCSAFKNSYDSILAHSSLLQETMLCGHCQAVLGVTLSPEVRKSDPIRSPPTPLQE